jgi:two-component system, NarL family, nitrate/nitrite response regulator NarL
VSDPIRVLIADDHAPTRADIRAALEESLAFAVPAAVSDAAAAVDAAVRERPDLCLLDIRMPGNGIAAAWEITARLPETKVVMLTVSRDDRDLFASLQAGASGYLLKDLDASALRASLESVVAGEAAMSRRMVARVLQEFRDRAAKRRSIVTPRPGPHLTSREWEVLNLLRRGLSTAEIAAELFISQATVRSHILATLRKLRVPDRRSAIQLFEE